MYSNSGMYGSSMYSSSMYGGGLSSGLGIGGSGTMNPMKMMLMGGGSLASQGMLSLLGLGGGLF